MITTLLGLYCLMTLFTVIKMNTFKEFFIVRRNECVVDLFMDDCRRRCKTRCFVVVWLFERVSIFSSDGNGTLQRQRPVATLRVLFLKLKREFQSSFPRAMTSMFRFRNSASISMIKRMISQSNIPEVHRDELLRVNRVSVGKDHCQRWSLDIDSKQ